MTYFIPEVSKYSDPKWIFFLLHSNSHMCIPLHSDCNSIVDILKWMEQDRDIYTRNLQRISQVWRGALILWESLEYYQTHLVPRRRQTFFNYYNSNVRNEISFLRFTVIFGRSSLNENRSLSRPSFLILKCREIQRILKCEYWFFLPFLKCLFYGTYSHEIINTLCLFWDPFLSKLKQTIQVDFTVEIACS